MPLFVQKRQEEIFADMLARVVTIGGLTDVTDSSGLKSVLSAFAREMDECWYAQTLVRDSWSVAQASGSDLDARAQEIGCGPRFAAQAAVGSVIFSRTTTQGSVAIPVKTQVTAINGQVFLTTQAGSIDATSAPGIPGHTVGQDSGAIPVVAQTAGTAGNVAAQTLTSLGGTQAGYTSVTNPAATQAGQDIETDDAYRARIFNYVASIPKGTPQALVAAVLGAKDPDSQRTITFASVVEDEQNPGVADLLIDDGTGQATTTQAVTDEVLTQGFTGPPPNTAVGGERRLRLAQTPVHIQEGVHLISSVRGALVMDQDFKVIASTGQVVMQTGLSAGERITASYSAYTGLVALAQKIVEGVPGDANYPGARAFGVQINVRTPQAITLAVQAVLTVLPGYDVAAVDAQVAQSIVTAINTLGIGVDVLRATLIQAAMNVPGCANILLTEPAQDLAVLDDQIARIASGNVAVA